MNRFELRKIIKEVIENEQTGSIRLDFDAATKINISEFDIGGKVRPMIDGSCYISSGIPENDFAFFNFLMLEPEEYNELFNTNAGELQFYIGGYINISSEFKLTNITIEYLKCKSKYNKKLKMFREGYKLLENVPADAFSKFDFQKEVIESKQTNAGRTSKKFDKMFMKYALENDVVQKFMTAYLSFKNYTQVNVGHSAIDHRNLKETYFIHSFSKIECDLEELNDLLISLGFTTEDDYRTAAPFTYEHDSGLKFSFYTPANAAGVNVNKIDEIVLEFKPIKDAKRAMEIIIEIAKFYDIGT